MPGILDSIFGQQDDLTSRRSGGILDNPLFQLGLKLAARGGPQKAPHSLAQDLSGAIEDYGAGQDTQTASQLKAMQMKAYRESLERNRKFREMTDPMLQRWLTGEMTGAGDTLREARGPGGGGNVFGGETDLAGGPPALPTAALQPPPTAQLPPPPGQLALPPPSSGVSAGFTGSGMAPFPAPGAPNGLPGYNIPPQEQALNLPSAPSPMPGPAPSSPPLANYIARTGAFESPKGYGVVNSIGARGRYQFKPETYAQYAELAGVDPNDWSPGAQDKVMERWSKANAGKIQMLGGRVDEANLYAMHLLGENKGAKFIAALTRDPSQPIGSIIPSSWQKANPAIFRGAKTLRDVRNNIQNKVFGGRSGALPAAAPGLGQEIQGAAPSPGGVPGDLFGEPTVPEQAPALPSQGMEPEPEPEPEAEPELQAPTRRENAQLEGGDAAPAGPRAAVDNATDLLGMPLKVRKQMMFGALLAAGGDADKFQEILGKSILDYNEKMSQREGKYGPIMFVTDGQGNNYAVHENKATNELERVTDLEGLQRQNTLNTSKPFSIDNPEDRTFAADIAAYRRQMPTLGRNMTPERRQQISNAVHELNPDYREGDYKVKFQARGKVFSGPKGDLLRSLNVATGHISQLEDLAGQLGNDSLVPINQIAQIIAHQTGRPEPTNFDTAKEIVADEIMKALLGSRSALEDRVALKAQFDRANSPEALYGALATAKSLLGGQLNGLRQELVEFGKVITPEEWNSALFPETHKALKVSLGGEREMGQGAAATGTPPTAGAGKVWWVNPKTGEVELK